MIPMINMFKPRLEPIASYRHVYAPRIIAMEPNISGITNMLRIALMYPKRVYLRAMSLASGYDGLDEGSVDRGAGDVVGSCSPIGLPQLLQKVASLSTSAPHFGQ